MSEIKIDSKLFQDRIQQVANAWKNDIRSKEGAFHGASSIVVLMGKAEESTDFHKNNAVHVHLFPSPAALAPRAQSETKLTACSSGFSDTSSRQR
jgi:nucleosome binding factor SPN SPT16 subunit